MISQIQTGVLLLNWDNNENILCHVDELTNWNAPPSIIIVDNASKTDISGIITKTFPEVTIIKNSVNLGFSGGNNIGFQYCITEGYEYILLLNHDADISEEIVYTLLEEMKSEPRIGAIGPCIQEGSKRYVGGRNIAHYPTTRIPFDPSGPLLREVDYLPGAACILRVSALEKVGVFDERYFFSGEMADLCLRIRDFGYSCVVHTGVCMTHDIKQNTPMRERIHLYYSVRNRFLFIRKHERYVSLWMVIWIVFALCLILGVIIKKKPHSAKAALLGICDGLIGRFGDHNEYFTH